jgi:predicted enzyme related to lactoylglutathione lyase
MAAPVVHFEFTSTNLPRLKTFYSSLFGWELNDEQMPGYTLVSTGGEGGIGGGMMAATGEVPPYFTMYVQVPDLQASLDQAVSLGGQVAVPPTEIPGHGAFAMFIDPDGNPVGLYKT